MKRVAIIGSRRYTNRRNVEKVVDTLPKDTVVISGGCCGVDTWAEQRAKARGLITEIYMAQKPKLHTAWAITKAYYARNDLIAKGADEVYAFVAPDRKGGTEYTIKQARKYGKPVTIY